jgi:hypothetical protein
MTRSRTIELPTMMVDALMALCLYLQRPPEPPLAESVKALCSVSGRIKLKEARGLPPAAA